MRYSNFDGVYEIFVEAHKGEKEEEVLLAIATASFEMAAVVEKAAPPVSKEDIRDFVRASVKLSDRPKAVVVAMDRFAGRWLATYIERVGPNHFCLCNAYQQYGGAPDVMLERARLILNLNR